MLCEMLIECCQADVERVGVQKQYVCVMYGSMLWMQVVVGA